MDRHRYLLWLALPLIAVGLGLVVLLNPDHGEYVVVGYLIGTVFGHATLASAWTAFGPLPLILRFPLALLWLVLSVACIALNVWVHTGPPEIPITLGGCVLLQYVALQLPFWAIALGTGVRLRYRASGGPASDSREYQFGIRQLMIFTAIVAVIFGVGRLVVTRLGVQLSSAGGPDLLVFIFLVVASVVMTLPLLLAGLLPRYWWQAVLVVLLLIGIATACELPLLETFHRGGGPDTLHLVWINAFSSAWILALVLVVRVSGYAAHIRTTLDAAAINVRRSKPPQRSRRAATAKPPRENPVGGAA